MQEVVSFLDQVDPLAAARARSRHSYFYHVSSADDGQAHGVRAAFGAGLSCEREAIDQLVDIQRNALAYAAGCSKISSLASALCSSITRLSNDSR